MSGYIGTQPVPQATQTRQTFVATAAQTSFATGGYQAGYLDVFLNGVKLQDGVDYTATNGSDIVLTVGAALDDTLEVVAYTAFEVVNAATAAQGALADTAVQPNDSPTFADLTLSGGVYLGGTGAANKLDDYESGTWTPTFDGVTVTNVAGRYIKVGKQVTIWFNITNGTSSGGTGQAFQMYGLPFLLDNSLSSRPVGSTIMFYSAGLGLSANSSVLVSSGSTDSLRAYSAATTGYTDVTVSRNGATTYMFAQFTYPTY
jgi:hypothetical protein